jgi:hypothetical protein
MDHLGDFRSFATAALSGGAILSGNAVEAPFFCCACPMAKSAATTKMTITNGNSFLGLRNTAGLLVRLGLYESSCIPAKRPRNVMNIKSAFRDASFFGKKKAI